MAMLTASHKTFTAYVQSADLCPVSQSIADRAVLISIS